MANPGLGGSGSRFGFKAIPACGQQDSTWSRCSEEDSVASIISGFSWNWGLEHSRNIPNTGLRAAPALQGLWVAGSLQTCPGGNIF